MLLLITIRSGPLAEIRWSVCIIIIWELFTPPLAGDLSLESKCQQVSSGFQDCSQYSSRSQQYYSLNGIDSFSDFLLFQPPPPPFLSFWISSQAHKQQLVSPSPSRSTFFLLLEQDPIYCYHYITPCEFFILTLVDGFSVKSEWEKVSSDLQNTSQYSGWLQ